ncbi:MAG: transglycosylase SLT domain-containing protein [Chitinispirillaceae bacterium]
MKTHAAASSETNTQIAQSRAMRVAKEFEAMFTSMMLKAMRKTVGESSLIPTSMGEKVYTQMLDDEYSKMTTDHASLGLADLIVKEIGQKQPGEGLNGEWRKDFDVPLWAVQNRAPGNVNPSGSKPVSGGLLSRVKGKWNDLISSISASFGMDEHLVTAVIARESAGNHKAVSHAGAKGLMQLMDGTAKQVGVLYPFSPAENIKGGVKYLKKMLQMFEGDEKLALAGYNAGPGAVRKHNGIPPYRETQEYVKAVLELRNKSAADAAERNR